MGEVFRGIAAWEEARHPWFDIKEPEPGTVAYQDYGHHNEYALKIEQELMPQLAPFLFQPATTANINDMKKVVDAYFATQWVVNEGVNVSVDVDPNTFGVKLTAVINYGVDGSISEEDDINYEVDFYIDDLTEVPPTVDFDISINYDAFEAVAMDGEAATEQSKKDTTSVDDVLFEPVDLEAERKQKPQPVHDDYGCYD